MEKLNISNKIEELNYHKYFELDNIGFLKSTVQYFGMSLKSRSNLLDETKEKLFLEKCKEIVESNIIKGVLLPPSVMNLVSYDTRLLRFVNNDRKILIASSTQEIDDIISDEKDIEYRKVLLFYIYTDLSKDELNEKFGFGFHDEGSIPKEK